MVEAESRAQDNIRKMILEEAIRKAKKIMEGHPEKMFTIEEYQRFHQCAYELSAFPGSDDNSIWIYRRFKTTLEESVLSIVLPSLKDKSDAALLRELILMWSNYSLMARWLCRFFEYLDRYFIPESMELCSLRDISVNCFKDLVFRELYSKFRAAAISLINQERMGLHIDRDLLKNVLLFFMEINKHKGVSYYEDFERTMLEETATYYSQLAQQMLVCDSSEDYMQKVDQCFNEEKARASYYLPCNSQLKLIEVVRCQLLSQPVDKLIENRTAENSGLVTDYQEMLSKYAGMTL
ncbi:cullin-1 isoform X2 [Manihot esculenta]|nr:cullin-1 isoform X2 [Manihot esculenta]